MAFNDNRITIEDAFNMQPNINGAIDFDKTVDALSCLHIRASKSFIEKLFYESDTDGIGRINLDSFRCLDEESIAQSNSDQAKALQKILVIAETNGSITVAEIHAIVKQMTGKE
ncbi:unnamed protein product [Adineta steineri]|uniref:Uncharacterized protein n=1 Tax=Adineta steineri TaxID=433720 RepID=A0A814YEJ7_9BILA|nr:unnamed protein product [Adineta steineri]CAF1228105.1 unnamed protein product [Adineta steineri]CAF3754383.1 unnamed protein product [Adineta steineri]CAF3937500.1 unnamed protein product [Adineta steineri]